MFFTLLMKDIFVKQLTIFFVYTTLSVFLNLCKIAKVTYKLE